MTRDVWSYQGGNVLPYFIQTSLLQITSNNLNFFGYKLFYFITLACVIISNRILLKWLTGYKTKYFNWNIEAVVCLSSLLVFEGLFVPGTLGAYSFGLASLAHLWPITLLVISLDACRRGSKNYLFALLAGLFIGNSNAGESLTCLLLLSAVLAKRIRNKREFLGDNNDSRGFLNFLYLGTTIGFACIFLAPGFWNRATVSVGLPENLGEVLARFFRAFASFSADLISHPILWSAFVIGVLTGGKILHSIPKNVFEKRFKFLFFSGLVLYSALILGSTFAYVSWHQSFGLYQILLILSFAIGIQIRSRISLFRYAEISKSFEKPAILFVAICFLFTGLTSTHGALNRSVRWDKSFEFNYCAIKLKSGTDLESAELVYPVFRLGIEDINSWNWMKDGYVKWISSERFHSQLKCK